VTAELEGIDAPYQVHAAAERLAAVREVMGPTGLIGVDLHGRVHKGMAKRIAQALEPYEPYFLEELVLAENNDALAALHSYASIPIATGERMYSRWDFKALLQAGTVDIIQPDLSHAGGISEVKRIAAMAEAYDVALAPHLAPGQLQLGQRVTAIRAHDTYVSIETNTSQRYTADLVVSTLPPYLLHTTVTIEPALPLPTQNIMSRTHTWMGDSIKIALSYPTPR
jgi:L-alanine-DL-glutamate epimerase-like enolase superfamily enzyme